ncbi:CheR family methyltransferase [Chitinivibrio alkaliphilus]|uniref:protein-glutamate O-methyltransferase n=1 Tax=Chitinivibrio alkaliphilus ACht1 TaxID=1313304 RepID=U7DAJ8_9BACT|nr:CheR family methyltransferase [Chitinivibrio alkaliphilus]ERP32157.1 CheR methyltransferase [Chitinivibrio alkaliphilus ACht1]
MNMITASNTEFETISRIVYDKFGIHLTDKKRTLVNSRLQSILRKYGFTSFSQYISYIQKGEHKDALVELINRISTNHTFFFREIQHFTFLKNYVLPDIEDRNKDAHRKKFKIWCAAASSGEEPYSLMIEILDYFGHKYSQWDGGLLATDISRDALDKAHRAIYAADRMKNISPARIQKYFKKRSDGTYEVKEQAKKEVLFKILNLVTPPYPLKGDFDLISCRNVMIYFDNPTKEALVQRLYDQLRPGGFLFTGHSESLNSLSHNFRLVQSAIYQKPPLSSNR